jgi:hypothetical protein
MKKIYLSIVAAVSLMFVSCTADWLNTDPSTAVPSDDAIKNIDDAIDGEMVTFFSSQSVMKEVLSKLKK